MGSNTAKVAALARAEVVSKLRRHRSALEAAGIGALYLYGSYSRDEATTQSDVDLYFEPAAGRKLDLFDLAGLQLQIEELLGVEIDIGTRSALHPLLRGTIEGDAVQVF